MIAFKITLQLIGDNFHPSEIIERMEEEYTLSDYHHPGDKMFENSTNRYDFGELSLMHPRVFGLENDNWEYEEWFVNFIERYHDLFNSNGIDDFRIFIDVFYSGDQCNFEIFNKNLVKRLGRCIDFSMPISIYKLKQKDIREMLLEAGFTKKEIEG